MVKESKPVKVSKNFIEKLSGELLARIKQKFNYTSNGEMLYQFVESIGGEIIPYEYTVEEQKPSGKLIICGNRRFTIELPQSTSPFRDNFTIAHEIGHYILHTEFDDSKHNDCNQTIIFYRNGSNQIQESQANLFAASLLMPRNEFMSMRKEYEDDLYMLSAHFDVSVDAIVKRVREI